MDATDDAAAMSKIPPILTEDVIYEILFRLPVKSVGRLKCVFKEWRSLLSSRQFARSHLHFHHLHAPQHIIVSALDHPDFLNAALDHYSFIVTLTTENQGSDGVPRDFKIPPSELKAVKQTLVEGSCHGLVMLLQDYCNNACDILLVNPITLETLRVPNPYPLIDYWTFSFYGLGYDSSHDDYKIVLISSHSSGVHVFSVKSKAWRNIGISTNDLPGISPYGLRKSQNGRSGVFFKGRLHWLARPDIESVSLLGGLIYHFICLEGNRFDEHDRVIAAFGLGTEEFEQVPYPRGYEDSQTKSIHLVVLGERLAMVAWDDFYGGTVNDIEVWLMKEKDYGVHDSWTKFTINCPQRRLPGEAFRFKALCFLGEDEIVFLNYHEQFTAYNLRSGVWRDLVVSRIHNGFHPVVVGRTFTESLVSPNYNQQTHHV